MNNNETNMNDLNNINTTPVSGDANASNPIGELPSMDSVIEVNTPEPSATPAPAPVADSEPSILADAPAQTIVGNAAASSTGGTPQPEVTSTGEQAVTSNATNPINENAQVQDDTKVPPSTENAFVEKETKKWPIVLLVIVLVIGGLCAYYNFVLTSPKNVVNKVMDGVVAKVKSYDVKALTSTSKLDSVNTTASVTLTSSNPEYQSMSGMSVKAKVGYDLTDNNKNIIELVMTLQGEKYMDFAASKIGNRSYFDLRDAYPNKLYNESDTNLGLVVDMPSISEEKVQKKKEDLIYIMEKVESAILDNITVSNLSKKMLFKDVGDAKSLVNEITYKADYEEYKKVSVGVYDALLADDKALEALGNLIDEGKGVAKELIINLKNDISEKDIDGDLVVIVSVDALSNKLVEMVIKDNSSSITYTSKAEEAKIVIDEKDELNIDLTIDEKENKIFADIKMIDEEEIEKMSITVKVNKADEKGADVAATLVMYDTKDVSKEVLSAVLQLNVEYNTPVTPVNTENAIDIKTLSEEEQEAITQSLSAIYSTLLVEGEE